MIAPTLFLFVLLLISRPHRNFFYIVLNQNTRLSIANLLSRVNFQLLKKEESIGFFIYFKVCFKWRAHSDKEIRFRNNRSCSGTIRIAGSGSGTKKLKSIRRITMRLLLAEDEKSLSRALVKILEHSNYSVDAVYDGEEALDYLDAGNYDGVILDIMMPKVDGLTVLQTIRRKGNRIPVLLLTAKSEIDDRVKGLDLGANDYLTKPFAPPELLARIRAMLRVQSEQQTDSSLHVGNITLDTTSYELSSPSGSFRLANKEYQMMELLMRHPKQVVSTEQFMDRIWGYDSEAEINVVWVYISYLRKKLTALKANISIKATRNVGYSLEVQA